MSSEWAALVETRHGFSSSQPPRSRPANGRPKGFSLDGDWPDHNGIGSQGGGPECQLRPRSGVRRPRFIGAEWSQPVYEIRVRPAKPGR